MDHSNIPSMHQNLVDKFRGLFPFKTRNLFLTTLVYIIGKTLRVAQEMEDSLKYFVSLSTAKIVFTKKCPLLGW